MPPPPPVSPPALTPAPAAGEEGQPPLPEAGAPGCSGSRPPELEPERSLGRLRGRFEDEDEELEEDEDLECFIKWLRRKPARGNGVVGTDPLPKDGGECG